VAILIIICGCDYSQEEKNDKASQYTQVWIHFSKKEYYDAIRDLDDFGFAVNPAEHESLRNTPPHKYFIFFKKKLIRIQCLR
jgi:hypothetical protein